MKCTFAKNEIIEALSPALGIAPAKNTVAGVEGVLITAGEDQCVLCAMDQEKGMRNTVRAAVERPGSYVLNAQKLSSILRTMPEGDITIEVDDRNVTRISGGRSAFELHALPGDNFPSLPDLRGNYGIRIPRKILKDMITKTLFSAAVNDPRPALNGLLIRMDPDGTVTTVGCDSNRLALRQHHCEIERLELTEEAKRQQIAMPDQLEFILPTRSLGELIKLMGNGDEEMMEMRFGHKHVIFLLGTLAFFTRRIEAQYIDYDKFIPKNNRIFVRIEAADFLDSLERAALVTEENNVGQSKSPLCCEFSGGVLKITTKSVTGSFCDEIPAEMEGDDLTIGFNCRYLMEALRAVGDETVMLSMSTPLMSMVIRPAEPKEDEAFDYLVLPVRLNR